MSTTRWTIEQARVWDAEHPWLCGFNYLPSYAVNWTEFWQPTHFDPATITRELGWARDLGFNTCRVYLPFLLWQTGAGTWAARVDKFLDIADGNRLQTLFVLFDDCSS